MKWTSGQTWPISINRSLFIFLVATKYFQSTVLISLSLDALLSSTTEIGVNDQECLTH